MRAPVHDLHASNLLTYLSLLTAVGAIAAARTPGGLAVAGALMAVAALADTFDGRFARRFTRSDHQRQFGIQLDSLVDAIVFGVVPIVVLEALPGRAHGPAAIVWWTGAFFYLWAAVTRLGFYNVEKDASGFVGLPTPAAALIWSTCLLWPSPSWLVTALFFACGAAMVYPVRIRRPRGTALAVFALWAASLVTAHTSRLLR